MAASSFNSEPDRTPVVASSDYGWTPPDATHPALRGITLRIEPGECVLLCGATGSGKSTLLRAIAGVLPAGGQSSGRIAVDGRAVLLLQDVDTQVLFTTVAEEVASGVRVEAGSADRRRRVEAALGEVGLEDFGERNAADLSAGERQRVVLAALLTSEPALLLLDEPTSALDPAACTRLVRTLARLKARGHTLLIAEHATLPFRDLATRSLALELGRLVSGADPFPAPAREEPTPAAPAADAPLLVRAEAVGVSEPDGAVRLAPLDLDVRRGERILLWGANGAGKTTLLHVLAGLIPPSHGRLELGSELSTAGGEPPKPGRVAFVLQNPPRNLFADTVAEELAFTLRRSGRSAAWIDERVGALLDACGLADYRNRSPLRLSFGQQHCVAILAALASQPALLLLDEPFTGLDAALRRQLLERIEVEQTQTGMAVVIASHAVEGLEHWAQRRVSLCDARLGTRERSEPAAAANATTSRRRRFRLGSPGRMAHYRDTRSPLHRLGVGWKLGAIALGAAAAVAADTPLALAALLAVWVGGYRLARLRPGELWQDLRWLLLQGAVVVALSALRGGADGALSGLRAAGQIGLFFLPGALLLRTTPTGRILDGVRRVLPPRLAFALATSLRFVPHFSREAHEMWGIQKLRGARLAPRELWRPRAWRDAVACLGVPLAVRTIHTANQVAQAAELRGIANAAVGKGEH